MGCFSYLCKKCGKGIKSTSFDGEDCIIFLLYNGNVVEKMEGRYNSYGEVFKEDGTCELIGIPIQKNIKVDETDDSFTWNFDEWKNLVDYSFSPNQSEGFAYYHKKCYNGETPTEKSLPDPNQGWGEEDEDSPSYFGDCSSHVPEFHEK